MFGVYCCTVSSLISNARWELLTEEGEAVPVARNSFSFKMPKGLPGKLTFLDPLSSYMEVVLEFPANIAPTLSTTLYHDIRDTFFTAMERAMGTLHITTSDCQNCRSCAPSRVLSVLCWHIQPQWMTPAASLPAP